MHKIQIDNENENVNGWIKRDSNFVSKFKKNPLCTINVLYKDIANCIVLDADGLDQITNRFQTLSLSTNDNNNSCKQVIYGQQLNNAWFVSNWKIQGFKW